MFRDYIVVMVIISCAGLACRTSDSSTLPSLNTSEPYTAFSRPVPVTIQGYDGDAMEPFISPDNQFLFFNDAGGSTKKDIFYARRVNQDVFVFQGPLDAINTPEVDGVPSVDNNLNFFFISTDAYQPPLVFDTVYKGIWTGSDVIRVRRLDGLARQQVGMVIFDVEVSRDGQFLYLSEGDFTGGGGVPGKADLVLAILDGDRYKRHPNSSEILARINTPELEYAAGISPDGRELFFTRMNLMTRTTGIYRAFRRRAGGPFEQVQRVSGIEGFVEAPALSPDGRFLYFHRLDPVSGRFRIYRMERSG